MNSPPSGRVQLAAADWRAYVDELCDVYHRRRDVILDSLAEHLPAAASWTRPQGGLFIWVTLPDFIDTTDLLARALAENVAFVPGEAAFVDGRGRHCMRLNFSSEADDDIREGVRRIGKIVAEQVALYETLTGRRGGASASGARAGAPAAAQDPAEPLANVLELPRRGAAEGRRSREA